MSTHKLAQRWLASAAVVTLAFAGCSKADTTTGSGSKGSDTTATTAVLPRPMKKNRMETKYAKIFRVRL